MLEELCNEHILMNMATHFVELIKFITMTEDKHIFMQNFDILDKDRVGYMYVTKVLMEVSYLQLFMNRITYNNTILKHHYDNFDEYRVVFKFVANSCTIMTLPSDAYEQLPKSRNNRTIVICQKLKLI